MPEPIQPSFSPRRRWKIGVDMFARTLLVVLVAVMANYIAGQFPRRIFLSSQTRLRLSPLTLNILHSITNNITVTLYYDRSDDFYPEIKALLGEYQDANRHISVRTVDYVTDVVDAQKVKAQYNLPSAVESPGAPPSKNLIIFDNGKRSLVVPGDVIVQQKLEEVAPSDPKQKELEFRRKPIAFNGEVMFTSKLLQLANPQPFKACFLQGDGEPSLNDPRDQAGYSSFNRVLEENDVEAEPLNLLGGDDVPDDCNLLIIAGPRTVFSTLELQKIHRYLAQGGRMFVLFNYLSLANPSGLEDILSHDWGVNVGDDIVQDFKNSTSSYGLDVVVSRFGDHPVVNPLLQSALEMIEPRPVSRIVQKDPPADAPMVTELAFTGESARLRDDSTEPPRQYSLIAAVEQKPVAGVASPRGNTRIIVAGDSLFLDNQMIIAVANRDFAGYAINWLLDRPQLVQGIGPRPVTELQLVMTQTQQTEVRWMLLGALPGAVLLLGGLVWMVRRK